MAKILIVDDNNLVVKGLSRLLESAGHVVDSAENGQQALQVISQKIFDLIILDIRMPGMNGIQIAEKIKQLNTKEIPIIFITGYTDEHIDKVSQKLNVSDFIYKPFDKDLFLQSVNKALKAK